MNRVFTVAAVAAIIGGCLLPGSARAQFRRYYYRQYTTMQDRGLSARTFLRMAAQGNRAEVRLGRLALRKSENDDVRRFAQTMIDDHGSTLEETRKYANNHYIDLPSGLSDEQRSVHERLSGLSGRDFDRAYVRAMVSDHEKDVQMWQSQASSGRNRDVREWASEKVPTLRHHLEMARDLWRDFRGERR